MPNSKRIIYLSDAQRQELFTNDTITVDGVTINYNENDIYVTPQEEPVTDVKINGTSITSNGVANVPVANESIYGVVKVYSSNGISLNASGQLRTTNASDARIKGGTDAYSPIVPSNQHTSAFYGLAKAAGSDMSSSSNPVGTYTDAAKSAIQSMLGISNLLAPSETTTASKAYSIGEVFTSNGKLYKTTAAIAAADAIVTQDAGESISGSNAAEVKLSECVVRDVQVNGTSIMQNGMANVPVASNNNFGVVRATADYGVYVNDNNWLILASPGEGVIKAGTNAYKAITPSKQHTSTFYGLAKAAGADMKDIASTVGTYPDQQKAAIQHMLGTDTNLASYEFDTTADQAYAIGELFMLNGKLHQATAVITIGDTLEVGTNCAVVNAAGVFTRDVQVNGTSVVSGGVANVPVASSNTPGVVKVTNYSSGLQVDEGTLKTYRPTSSQIKAGSDYYRVIVPSNQHESTFYGLAKAAGDTSQSASSNAVGTYTDSAKASIKSMLGIIDGSTGTVDITGTTPTITAVENTRYVCGEVSTLSFTPPASGISIVRFTSGTTATVLTLPSTVKFPEWFDPTTLEADTIYEMCITDGIYGAVMSWAL